MVNELKMLDSKSDSDFKPQQNTQQPTYQKPIKPQDTHNIPEIDIDIDEIPF
jgi:hypothetical protein